MTGLLLVGLGVVAPVAQGATVQTSLCVDGGGHLWKGRSVWGAAYVDAGGLTRIDNSATGFTTSARDATTVDYSVRAYDSSGELLQTLTEQDRPFAFADGTVYLTRNPVNMPSAPSEAKVVVTVGDGNDGFGNCTMTFTQPASMPATVTTNLPGQPAITAYDSASAAIPYAHQGALVIAGRDNYAEEPMRDASAAGATVLIYLDAIIDNPAGRYHTLLVNSSACGPATSRWSGSPKANSYGYLQDFRVGSVVQSKLRCVLETMVAENPHMGGFFADDLGSRSWFPDFDWDTWGPTNQRAYRDGAIALAQTFHDVAVEHGLVVMVNGTWAGGSLDSSGGGYPVASRPGLSLADGGYIEHHDIPELPYWTAYARGQWGSAAGSASQGQPFMYVQANDDATRSAYNAAGVFAFLSTQREYGTATVWGAFHSTGLPSGTDG